MDKKTILLIAVIIISLVGLVFYFWNSLRQKSYAVLENIQLADDCEIAISQIRSAEIDFCSQDNDCEIHYLCKDQGFIVMNRNLFKDNFNSTVERCGWKNCLIDPMLSASDFACRQGKCQRK